MTTPSGTISLNDVNVELGLAGTTLISMNQTNVRTLAGVGGSGTTISMNDLRGKSNRVTASATISANTSNYVLNTAKATGYVSGKTDMTLTIASGVYISSGSTGSYAFTIDTTWASGDTVTVVNNGTIIGKGGNGGAGGSYQSSGQSGFAGGPALLAERATTINNLNRISGGGGGGGGGTGEGQDVYTKSGLVYYTYGGGGGGGGIGEGQGGARGTGNQSNGTAGGNGTLTSNGGGGSPAYGFNGAGGAGGSYGASGSNGNTPNGYFPAGSGGAGGAAVVGNSNITWTNTGTRNGSIS